MVQIYVSSRHAIEEYYETLYKIFVRKSEEKIPFPNISVNGWIL